MDERLTCCFFVEKNRFGWDWRKSWSGVLVKMGQQENARGNFLCCRQEQVSQPDTVNSVCESVEASWCGWCSNMQVGK